jgi:hypothetical protein
MLDITEYRVPSTGPCTRPWVHSPASHWKERNTLSIHKNYRNNGINDTRDLLWPMSYATFFFLLWCWGLNSGSCASTLPLEPCPVALLLFSLFSDRVLCFAQAVLKIQSFYLCLLSSLYYMYVPLCLACFWDRVSLTFAWTGLEPWSFFLHLLNSWDAPPCLVELGNLKILSL